MSLYLVGDSIDRHRAFAAAQAGDLLQLYRGIYVDARDDADEVVLDHAVRIAAYLYPQAYLAGISAALLAPTPDGRLFLSGRRNGRTRIRGLEIIQNQAPEAPSTVPVVVGDDRGELHLAASSPRQRFLEAFRQRSEHAGAIDLARRREFAERLIAEYGDAAGAADALWQLARPNRWLREAEAAEDYLRAGTAATAAPVNKAGLDLTIAWHGDIVGRLVHDGAEWRWMPRGGLDLPLIRASRPGSLPPFIENLLPEGWLADVLNQRSERDILKSGSRYMSNIAIVADPGSLATMVQDVLAGRLAQLRDGGRFTGHYRGPGRRNIEDGFEQRLAQLYASRETPRLSGVQIKAPMFLSSDGDLVPATDEPFTHILKPAGTGGFEPMPVVEWICLMLAGAAGFEVPDVALVDMPDGMPPALLVERFDIRRTDNDTRRMALEDFCSILELPARAKYEGTVERMARGLRAISTSPVEDLELLFSRALFAWLIADGDMHLKNLAVLKTAETDAQRFGTVRFSPVYDTVTTIVFPKLETDRMAFRLNGKDARLNPDDFRALARTMDLTQSRADVLMASCARALADAVTGLVLPEPFRDSAGRVLDRIRQIVADRTQPFV